MKTISIICLVLLLAIAFMFGYSIHREQCKPCSYCTCNDVNAYHIGDTLMPDYSHSDMLIVTNADSLNKIFDGVETPVPTTDMEISIVLHKFCVPVTVPDMSYQIVLMPSADSIAIYDGYRFVGYIPASYETPIGNLIYKDNE